MNIRDHIRKAIHTGLPANFTQQSGKAGALFHDDNEFIPFDDLNYNNEYGYYRLSQFPNLQRGCTNGNQETLHYGSDFGDNWRPIIWADSGGNLNMIGDIWQAADLYQALGRLLIHGEIDPEEISENDSSWDYMKRIDWAIREYRDFFGDGRPDAEIGNTIRSAANAKRIWGCSQDSRGNWYFRPESYRGWLVKTRDEKRGRPRKTAPDLIENFDGNVSCA